MDKKLVAIVLPLLGLGFVAGLSYGCVFRNVFHIICPSCGISRGWLELFRGNISGAFSANPMFWFPPLAILLCCFKKPVFGKKAGLIILAILAALYLLLYIFRVVY